MFTCPQCGVAMERARNPFGVHWRCPQCDGRSATIAMMRRYVPRDPMNVFWQTARSGLTPIKRTCPACRNAMREVNMLTAQGPLPLDVCPVCQFVWFDRGEFERTPQVPRRPDLEDTLPPSAREKLALMQMDAIRERSRGPSVGEETDTAWYHWLPGLFGLPVEVEAPDTPPIRPWGTWILAAAILFISLVSFADLPSIVQTYGMIPAEFARHGGLTLVTSFFLHGGLFHLLSNLYFLIVFGDNVEAHLGRGRYLLLIALAALAGDALHILGEPGSAIPSIGASGGISGILAFYALQFPHARLGILFRYFVLFKWLRFPAWGLFVFWLVLQFLGLHLQREGLTNVSALAHLGGVAAGVLAWIAFREQPAGAAAVTGYRRQAPPAHEAQRKPAPDPSGIEKNYGGRYDRRPRYDR